MSKYIFRATITLTFPMDSESFPEGAQTPAAMARFTEKQIKDGDAGVEDVVSWGDDHEVSIACIATHDQRGKR